MKPAMPRRQAGLDTVIQFQECPAPSATGNLRVSIIEENLSQAFAIFAGRLTFSTCHESTFR